MSMRRVQAKDWVLAFMESETAELLRHQPQDEGSLVELVEQQPATRCVVGSIPAGSALEVWPWTLVLNSLVG